MFILISKLFRGHPCGSTLRTLILIACFQIIALLHMANNLAAFLIKSLRFRKRYVYHVDFVQSLENLLLNRGIVLKLVTIEDQEPVNRILMTDVVLHLLYLTLYYLDCSLILGLFSFIGRKFQIL